MDDKVYAMALIQPNEGQEQECLSTLEQLFLVLRSKQYSHDLLLKDVKDGRWILVRTWSSSEAPANAQEDPEVYRLWERLSHMCKVERVREGLREIHTEFTSPEDVLLRSDQAS